MDESDRPNERLWSFPEGMVGPEDSVKDFEVEASDGHAGKVSWASYAPGPLDYSIVEALRSATSTWRLGGDVQ